MYKVLIVATFKCLFQTESEMMIITKQVPKVCTILLNYNGVDITFNKKSILKQSLGILKKQDYRNNQIIVTDDGSTDSSVETLKRYKVDIISIKNNTYNIAKVINIGIKYAMRQYNPKYLLIMANDVFILDKNLLRSLVETAEKYEDACFVGCEERFPSGKVSPRWQVDSKAPSNKEKIYKVYKVSFVCFLIRVDSLRKIGLLDENFRMSSEDADFMIRAKDAGFELIQDERVGVLHLGSYTMNAIRKSVSEAGKKERYYYSKANMMYLLKKHIKHYGVRRVIYGTALFFVDSLYGIDHSKKVRFKIFAIKRYYPYSYFPVAVKAFIRAMTMKDSDTRFTLSENSNEEIEYLKFSGGRYRDIGDYSHG